MNAIVITLKQYRNGSYKWICSWCMGEQVCLSLSAAIRQAQRHGKKCMAGRCYCDVCTPYVSEQTEKFLKDIKGSRITVYR